MVRTVLTQNNNNSKNSNNNNNNVTSTTKDNTAAIHASKAPNIKSPIINNGTIKSTKELPSLPQFNNGTKQHKEV